MSFSGWLHNVAVGGFLVALLLAPPVSAQENKAKQKNQAKQTQTEQKPPAPQPPPATAIDGPKPIEADWNKVECAKPKNHDEADLCEQRRMSKAAENSVVLNTVQIGLGTIGAGLVLWSLYYTRAATRIAGIAASAAADSVRLSAVTAEQQLRAYVTISMGEIRVSDVLDDIHFSAVITLRNSGNTPAYKFRAWVRSEIARFDAPPFRDAPSEDGPFSILGPGLEAHTESQSKTVGGMREDISMGGYRVFVWGQATYETMGQARTFTFRAWDGPETSGDVDSDPLGDKWGGWVMTPHPSGYEST